MSYEDRNLYDTDPMYRAQVLSRTTTKPNDRMLGLTRPDIKPNRKRRVSLGTVAGLYESFGFQRSTRRS